jgi:hypothetical protein
MHHFDAEAGDFPPFLKKSKGHLHGVLHVTFGLIHFVHKAEETYYVMMWSGASNFKIRFKKRTSGLLAGRFYRFI